MHEPNGCTVFTPACDLGLLRHMLTRDLQACRNLLEFLLIGCIPADSRLAPIR